MAASLETREFGRMPDGSAVRLFTLTNSHGLVARITDYGAILTGLHVPDRTGQFGDVVLGFDTLEQYLAGHPFFGATVGRVANRIAGGHFTLNGKEYRLAVNNGPNSLHGGSRGFDKVLWQAGPGAGEGVSVRFSYLSPDGEEGYPGNLSAAVTYTLTEQNELRLDYEATTDQDTPVNLTNHSYFNLADGGDVLRQELTLIAHHYTPVDETLIPTGEIRPVQGTPMDFTHPHPIGARIGELADSTGGYDHNFVLDSGGETLALGARARDPQSGRIMEMLTTEPGVQFYTGNFLDGTITGKGGVAYPKHGAFCLEAQHFPDSVHRPEFPSVILSPGQVYTQTTIYRFLTE